MPLDLTDDKSTLVQIMAWYHQATSHYLSHCWPRSISPNGVTRPQWVKATKISLKCLPLDAQVIFMPPPLGAGGIMFSGCPSVRPAVRPSEAWNTLFWPVHGSVGPPDQPLPFYGMSVHPSKITLYEEDKKEEASMRCSLLHGSWDQILRRCPSVRPERFPGICGRTHGGSGLKFCTLMCLGHLQNWLVYGHGLLIFVILALFWLSETGQIWGFRALSGERMEEMACNFARQCILTTFRTD